MDLEKKISRGGRQPECTWNNIRRWSWDKIISTYKKRAKPAVPLGANYRLIDIPDLLKFLLLNKVPRILIGFRYSDLCKGKYLWLFEEHNVMEFLVLAGDHLYRMDYERFIQAHRGTDADITVAALPMDEKRATAFGLMKIDEEGRIIEFAEKPKGEQLKAMKVDTTILGLDDEKS
ncbi:hypothetical protein IFM89_034215 [Coptis chinensis]|uniref:glucose-1-phosphate adenylyltransferase n=1 Tax=Coptis chinensis TaxID=261450 RepID=A0A835LGE9_9MAGN|nr:hypothetical protein IFM89_034215 [Coptis chinensis]